MKKKKKRLMVVSLVTVISILGILCFVLFNTPDSQRKMQDENSNTFLNNVTTLKDGQDYLLSDIASFGWDYMYVFSEYTDVANIEKAIGLESNRIHMSDSEGMQQVIFVKNKEVVGYIQGMDYKLGFSIERNSQDYLEAKNDSNNKLYVNTKDGIKYLEFKSKVQ